MRAGEFRTREACVQGGRSVEVSRVAIVRGGIPWRSGRSGVFGGLTGIHWALARLIRR